MKQLMPIFLMLVIGGCESYSGRGLKPGEDRLEDVLHVMGQPAMRWQNADGSSQLAYPRGPMGFHTYMVTIGSDGKLRQIENVMDENHFGRVQPGMSKEEVLRILGPAFPGWTAYFKARDELAWEWRFCNTWLEPARLDVLFDNSKATVRTTISATEGQLGLCDDSNCLCSK